MLELDSNAKRHVVTNVPRDIKEMLTMNANRLVLGGGFIRDVLSSTPPNDIDLFCDTAERAAVLANDLCKAREGRMHATQNAITVLATNYLPVQFITRWTYARPHDVLKTFDFTVCQAALWRQGGQSNAEWRAQTGPNFFRDLAGRNLVYTPPVREEEAGGSMMRMTKFLRRGWHIQIESLSLLIERVSQAGITEGKAVVELLREVDPLRLADGLDLIHDHEEPVGDEALAAQQQPSGS